jgi:ABC-2 type transport system permease protein
MNDVRVFPLGGFRSSPQSNPFLSDLWLSLRQPEFWGYSSWLDLVCKYRRTRLGILWMFLPMATWMLILGNFYARVMSHPSAEYLPYLGVGYSLWRFIVMCTNEASGALRQHKPFIMDGRTRLTDFVLRTIAKALMYFIFAQVVVQSVLLWSPAIHWQGMLSVFLTFPVIVVNMIWWVTLMALFGARYPDTTEAVHTALMLGFLLTPILWMGNRFDPHSPAGLLVRLNPAYHLIEVVRAPVLGQPVPISTFIYLAVLTLGGWCLTMVVYRRYARFVPLWI